jgi:hypothetical protein
MWQPEPEPVQQFQPPFQQQPRPAANGRRPLAAGPEPEPPSITPPDGVSREDAYLFAYRQVINETGERPNARRFVRKLNELYGGDMLPERIVVNDLRELHERYAGEMNDQFVP